MGYTKLFSELVASSVWDEDDKTRIVWITMLALKDRFHFVRGTMRYLALAARVTEEQCKKALEKLGGPDEKSRTQDNEGRRIKEDAGGWFILNGDKYQKLLSLSERREYNRRKQAEYRRRQKSLKELGKDADAAIRSQVKSYGRGDIDQDGQWVKSQEQASDNAGGGRGK